MTVVYILGYRMFSAVLLTDVHFNSCRIRSNYTVYGIVYVITTVSNSYPDPHKTEDIQCID